MRKVSFYKDHLSKLTGSEELVSSFLKYSKETYGSPEPVLARLACFDDVGGKKRYIALGN